MAMHCSITSRSTGREKSRRLRTDLVVVNSSSGVRFNAHKESTPNPQIALTPLESSDLAKSVLPFSLECVAVSKFFRCEQCKKLARFLSEAAYSSRSCNVDKAFSSA